MKNKLINLVAFSILSILWLVFIVALIVNQQVLIAAWQVFSTWPLLIQIVVGLLALPVIAGLWIWQTTWALALRIVLVLGLVFVTVYLFFPRKNTGQMTHSTDKS